MTRKPGRAPVRIRRHGAHAPGAHRLDQPPRPQGLPRFAAPEGEDQSAARRLVSNVHHRIRVHGSVSFRPTQQTPARREQLMRISCSWSRTRGRRFAPSRGAAGHIRDVAGTREGRARDRGETAADSKKHSYGPMHRWCRSACAERANRAPKASTGEVRKKRKYSRTCSRRRPARSKGDREMVPDPDRPKGQPRGAPSRIHDAPSH